MGVFGKGKEDVLGVEGSIYGAGWDGVLGVKHSGVFGANVH